MKSILIWLAAVFFLSVSCQQESVVLSNKGKTQYSIVIPDGASSEINNAATELQSYLKAIGGADFSIDKAMSLSAGKKIYVGWPTGAGATPQAQITMAVKGDQLFISGGNDQSTLFAVYTFLEKYFGVRYYAPGEELVPQLKKMMIPKDMNYVYTPSITTRTVHSKLFYEHPDFAAKQKVTTEAFPGYVPDARVHTFGRFMPEGEYYKSHPEYYALRNGRRIPTQLCLSNPKVFDIVRDRVAELLEQHPKCNVISVSQGDNTQYCQCKKCEAINKKEGSPAGSVIEFVNRIAREFPDKQISTLAYQYTRKAPLHIKPEPNVLITLCSIECDRSAPIAEKSSDFATDLIEWGALTDNIRIWDYTTQFTNFLAPFPNLHTLQPNIQLFRDNHAKWVFEQHSHNPSELFELRSYLTAKLLWNPDLDVDSVMNDFLTGYYAEAAPYVKNYITTVHEELKKDKDFFLFLYGDPSQAFDSFLRPELLSRFDKWYDEAESVVAGKPNVLKRVKKARLSVDFAILEASRQQLTPEFSLAVKNQAGKYIVSEQLIKRLTGFAETCSRNNITLLNEMGYRVEEYVELYQNTLERAMRSNLARGKQVKLLTTPKKYADENPQALTDGAFGGPSFYANWLGFEGNNAEAVIDLGDSAEITNVSTAFLQVVNHLVVFPVKVAFYYSADGKSYKLLKQINNKKPLTRESKINDIQYFTASFPKVKARYVKVKGVNMKTPPVWHHGAGMPSWIFMDEVMVR